MGKSWKSNPREEVLDILLTPDQKKDRLRRKADLDAMMSKFHKKEFDPGYFQR